MTTITETATWREGIYQLETTDPDLAGVATFSGDGITPVTGHLNAQAKLLADRTLYLKTQVEAQEGIVGSPSINAFAPIPIENDKFSYFTGGAMANTPLTAEARVFLTASTKAAQRASLGLGDTVSGPATSDTDRLPLFADSTGKILKDSGTVVTAAGRALLDDADVTAQRNTLLISADVSNLSNTTDTAKGATLVGYRNRTLSAETDDRPSIKQFIPAGHIYGTDDAAPYFTLFFAAVKAKGCRGFIQSATYKLNSNVLGDWTQVIEYDQNVVFTGVGILFAIQKIIHNPVTATKYIRGSAGSFQTVGSYSNITSDDTNPNYGSRQDFLQLGALTSGFSLAQGNIAEFRNITAGQGMASWQVSTSPTTASGGSWGVVVEEGNVMNRAADNGFKRTRAETSKWTGGYQMVPETDDLAGGTGNICRNTLFGFATCHSANLNDLGFHVKTYNGLLIEKDSIGPSGRGVLASGDTSAVGGSLPAYAFEVDQRWAHGLYTVDATFTGNIAVRLGNDQNIAWGASGSPTMSANATSGNLAVRSSGTGTIVLASAASTILQMPYIASSVNFFNMYANATGSNVGLAAVGTDTNISMDISAKGTGNIRINTGNLRVATVGKGLTVAEGSNAKQGVATLVAGSVVVSNTSVTATSRIFLTSQSDGGTPGWVRVSARTAATSFTITSSSGTDTSVIAYQIFEAT